MSTTNNNTSSNNNSDDNNDSAWDAAIEVIENYLNINHEEEYKKLVADLYIENTEDEINWNKQRLVNDYFSGDVNDNYDGMDSDEEDDMMEWANSKTQVSLDDHDEMVGVLKTYFFKEYDHSIRDMYEQKIE